MRLGEYTCPPVGSKPALLPIGPPTPMQESFRRAKENLVRDKTNHDHHDDDRKHLVHGMEFTSEMQQLAESQTTHHGDVDLSRHQRAPGKCPALLHAAHNGWQGSRGDNMEP